MQVNQAARALLEKVNQRLSTLPPHQFHHLSAAHPSAHITNRPGPRSPSLQFVCGGWLDPAKTVLAKDGSRLCDRCAGWLRGRSWMPL